MAIFHFAAQVISRSDAGNAVAAAAYRAGMRLTCERTGQTFNQIGGGCHRIGNHQRQRCAVHVAVKQYYGQLLAEFQVIGVIEHA